LCPFGLAFDGQGNLWVADNGNNRVLQYWPPFSNGMAASLVLGQANFTTYSLTPPSTSSTIWFPMSLAFDTSGRLFVADMMANRTLIFTPPFSNNMAATLVIGQQDFAHWLVNQGGGYTPAANTLAGPFSVATW
jgi:sugar lactone lactonase YvrE